jgi:hypothetical protein
VSLSDEIAVLDATAQAALVRHKKLKPIGLVDAAMHKLNA